jgi:hypothetical protein
MCQALLSTGQIVMLHGLLMGVYTCAVSTHRVSAKPHIQRLLLEASFAPGLAIKCMFVLKSKWLFVVVVLSFFSFQY